VARRDLTLDAVNKRLRATKAGIQVRQKGNRLYLRGTLPPKPGGKRRHPHQQELSLGIYANPAGLERAESEARKVGALLACKEFNWAEFLGEAKPAQMSTAAVVEQFQQHYIKTHTLTERTWQKHWASVFNRLPQDQSLSAGAVLAVVLRTEQDSRSRKQTCQKLQRLATFAGLNVDLRPYQGNYSPAKVKPRELPGDDLIAEWRKRVGYKPWQWFYGMLATYGLRPHEAFFCEFIEGDADHALQVLEGKTGPRVVYPLYLEWVKRWQLWDIQRPQVNLSPSVSEVYEEYGRRACRQFKRYGLPFVPYDLRHAYAIRASVEFGFPVATAAAYMGHAPTVHWNRYNRWISERQHAKTFRKYMDRENRPIAP
jgi:integrase